MFGYLFFFCLLGILTNVMGEDIMTGPGLVSMVTAMAEILNSDLASLISATLKMTQEVGVSELESVCVRERVWFNFPSHNCNFDLHFCIFLS